MRADMRRAVKAYWEGKISYTEFRDQFTPGYIDGLERAFRVGSRQLKLGIKLSDPAYQKALKKFIDEQAAKYVLNFGRWIKRNSKENGGELSKVYTRLGLWENRYREARNQAKLRLGGDVLLMWRYGDTRHCDTCSSLNGEVMTADEWNSGGVYPQDQSLDCGGWRCQCELVVIRQRESEIYWLDDSKRKWYWRPIEELEDLTRLNVVKCMKEIKERG